MAETTFHSIKLPGIDAARAPAQAAEFNTGTAYAVKDYCTYQGVLYRCTTAHAAGAWNNGADFMATNLDNEFDRKLDIPASSASAPANPRVGDLWIDNDEDSTIYNVDAQPTSGSTNAVQSGGTYTALNGLETRKANRNLFSGDYSTSAIYEVDQLVMNGAQLYRCKTRISTPEAWNASHWQATNLNTEFNRLRNSEADTDMIAETFGMSDSYAVGDYIVYNSNLYRCKSAVSNTGSWDPDDWIQVTLADEVQKNKTDLESINDVELIKLIHGYYITTNTDTININEKNQSDAWNYAIIDCIENDIFTVNGKGGVVPLLWAFINNNDNNNRLTHCGNNESANNLQLVAPAGATKLIINSNINSVIYKGKTRQHRENADTITTINKMMTDFEIPLFQGTIKGTGFVKITNVFLPKGKYKITVDNITSSDIDDNVSDMNFYGVKSAAEIKYIQWPREQNQETIFELTEDCSNFNFYAAKTAAKSSGDTFEFTNCTITLIAEFKDNYDKINEDISNAYNSIVREKDGNYIKINDGIGNHEILEFNTYITPEQEGSGIPSPDNIRTIKSQTGYSLFNIKKNFIDDTKYYIANNTMLYIGINNSSESIFAPKGEYTFSFSMKNKVRYRVYFIYTGASWDSRLVIINETGDSEQVTLELDGRPFKIWFYATSGNVQASNVKNVQLERGNIRTDYEAFDKNEIYTSWEDDIGPIYGCNFNKTTGEFVVTHKLIQFMPTIKDSSAWTINNSYAMSFNNPEDYTIFNYFDSYGYGIAHLIGNYIKASSYGNIRYIKEEWTCSPANNGHEIHVTMPDEYDTLEKAQQYFTNNPLQICYELATPKHYNLQPTQIFLFKGINNLWQDIGTFNIKYYANTILFSKEINNELNSNLIYQEENNEFQKIWNTGYEIACHNKYVAHNWVNESVSSDATNFYIPSQSIYDIEMSARLGYKMIEGNVHPTATYGKYVVMHGSQGKLGNQLEAITAGYSTDSSFSSLTYDEIRNNYVYRNVYNKYRTPITSLEEFCLACKQFGMIPLIQYVDEIEWSIVESILGKNVIGYNVPREVFKGITSRYSLHNTKEEIIAQCKEYGPPYMYSFNSPYRFTDSELEDIIKEIHKQGYICSIAGAYLTPEQERKYLSMGVDMSGSGWSVEDFETGNILDISGDIDFEEFDTNGSTQNAVLTLTNGQYIRIQNTDTHFLQKCSLHITFDGSILLSMGKYINNIAVTSNGKEDIWFSSLLLNRNGNFTIISNGNTNIKSITYKLSKC